MRGEDEHVARGEHRLGVGPVAQEREPPAEIEPAVEGVDLVVERTLADGDEACLGRRIEDGAGGGQQDRVRLLRPVVRHRAHEHLPRFDAERGAHRLSLRPCP